MLPALAALTLLLAPPAGDAPQPVPKAAPKGGGPRVFELRTYTAAPGKFDAMVARLEKSVPIIEKHKITVHGAFVPAENAAGKAVLVVSFESEAARKANWLAFGHDPEQQALLKATGDLLAEVDVKALQVTNYSPDPAAFAESEAPRVYELRTYTATPNNLDGLNDRFRNTTLRLFKKHGMQNVVYWKLPAGAEGADTTLIYLLAHASAEARDKSFDAFRKDPAWLAAKTESERLGGGSLTTKDGVQSLMLTPLAFSKLK